MLFPTINDNINFMSIILWRVFKRYNRSSAVKSIFKNVHLVLNLIGSCVVYGLWKCLTIVVEGFTVIFDWISYILQISLTLIKCWRCFSKFNDGREFGNKTCSWNHLFWLIIFWSDLCHNHWLLIKNEQSTAFGYIHLFQPKPYRHYKEFGFQITYTSQLCASINHL